MQKSKPIGVSLWVTAVGCATPSSRVGPNAPDVVLIVVDTTRADAVAEANTPVLDDLASDGISISHAWAASTWTAPSTMSLMLGAHVSEHGWDLPFPRHMRTAGESYSSITDMPTLAEVMSTNGYDTIGVYANPLLSRQLGWERGFDVWKRRGDRQLPRQVSVATRDLDPDNPLFLYVHLKGPHQPLRPSMGAARRWGVNTHTPKKKRRQFLLPEGESANASADDQYRRAYRAVIEDTDAVIGDVLSRLDNRTRDRLVIVTSDHGELLGEHGSWGHDFSVWNPLTHVPLILNGPDLPPIPDVISTAAIPDIITRSVGISATWPHSLDAPPIVVSEREGHIAVSGDGEVRGVWGPSDVGFVGAFDVTEDPGEMEPLVDFAARAGVAMLRARWSSGLERRQRIMLERNMDDETAKLLEELGYMDATEAPSEEATDTGMTTP